MKQYAVVDIGTNSARLMIAHIENGIIVADYKTLRLIRVGEGMVGKRQIVQAAMERTKNALNDFFEISKSYDVKSFYCFATSAIRDADNRTDYVDYIKKECGIEIDIISGDDEAMLGFAGSVNGQGGMFDIGGGSTEVMIGSLDHVLYQHSFQIGTVRLLQMFPTADDADPAAYENAHKLARETFADIPAIEGFVYTGIGGTATALAAIDLGLAEYKADLIQGHIMSLDAIEKIEDMLKSKTKEQRKHLIGLEENKADVIVFGVILCSEFLNAVNAEQIIVSDSDNQEGYLKFKLGMVQSPI